MPVTRIAREFGHSRNTVRKILRCPEPNPIPGTRERPAPVLGPVQSIIDQILVDDDDAPPKQRHTAMQVFAASATRSRLVGRRGSRVPRP
jgi:hypothetical protein